MKNKEIENKIKHLKEFMQLWMKFHDMYKDAISRETISPEDEKNFLETESLIARKYQALKSLFGMEPSYEDRTYDVISQILSLKSVAAISDLSLDKIESDWHDSYLMLNKLLGELEGQQESLSKISRLGLIVKKISSNPLTSLLILAILIVAVYFLITYFQKSYRVEEEVKGKIEFKYDNK